MSRYHLPSDETPFPRVVLGLPKPKMACLGHKDLEALPLGAFSTEKTCSNPAQGLSLTARRGRCKHHVEGERARLGQSGVGAHHDIAVLQPLLNRRRSYEYYTKGREDAYRTIASNYIVLVILAGCPCADMHTFICAHTH